MIDHGTALPALVHAVDVVVVPLLPLGALADTLLLGSVHRGWLVSVGDFLYDFYGVQILRSRRVSIRELVLHRMYAVIAGVENVVDGRSVLAVIQQLVPLGCL